MASIRALFSNAAYLFRRTPTTMKCGVVALGLGGCVSSLPPGSQAAATPYGCEGQIPGSPPFHVSRQTLQFDHTTVSGHHYTITFDGSIGRSNNFNWYTAAANAEADQVIALRETVMPYCEAVIDITTPRPLYTGPIVPYGYRGVIVPAPRYAGRSWGGHGGRGQGPHISGNVEWGLGGNTHFRHFDSRGGPRNWGFDAQRKGWGYQITPR